MEMSAVLALGGVGVTILVQTITVVWFFARLNSRVEWLERGYEELRNARYEPRLAKIETLLEIVQSQQDEQIHRLDALVAKIGAKVQS